jgi:predicted subunit of tRNA(5-methylaminomethyl-2-thiouridylate) methyltransferase
LKNHDDVAASLEQLLESLIKMVGRANKNNDNLQKEIIQLNENMESQKMRISQLEWIMKGQLKERDWSPIRTYPTHHHTHTPSEIHDQLSHF